MGVYVVTGGSGGIGGKTVEMAVEEKHLLRATESWLTMAWTNCLMSVMEIRPPFNKLFPS